MKKIKFLFSALLFCALIGFSQENQIIIKGKIIGDIPEKVEYTTPINGTWFYGSKKSVQPDSLGNFQITMNIDSPSFITLYIPKKANGTLLVEPGEAYSVNFNLISKDKKFRVTGGNSKGQNIYNSFPNPEFNIYGVNEYLKDSINSVIISKIKEIKEKEILLFKDLFDKGEISEGFFTLVKLDRKCYYSAVQGSVASYKFREGYQKNNEELKASSLNLWNDTFITISNPMLNSSPWFHCLIENYINYKEYTNSLFDLKELTEIYMEGRIHSHHINESEKYLTNRKLEYYYASYIYYHCWQNEDNSKELITLYHNFKEDYPNSKYTKYLTGIIAPIVEFHKKVEEVSISTKIKFIDDFENINSFNELTKTLRGKKTYIDIWGTWCGPCKKEFQYKDELNRLLKSKGVNVLYICEGKNSKEKVWKEMIKGYNLEGHHIRANNTLLADIIKIFGDNGSFYYPRYILIDENGNVINKYVAKPSQLPALEKELNKL